MTRKSNRPLRILTLTTCMLIITIFAIGILCACNESEDKPNFEITPDLNFIVNDTLEDGAGKHAKVIILAGQSNATGCASTQLLKENVGDEKFAEYETGYDNVYINYNTENGRNKSDGFVKTNPSSFDTFGPEIGLAEVIGKEDTTYFIIKYAYGGSILHWHWAKERNCLFQAMTAFVNKSIEYLQSKNYDTEITDFLWMQGESDASEKRSKLYYANTKQFVADMREEFGSTVKFIDAGISDSECWGCYKKINQAKIKYSNDDPLAVYIDTIGEGLTYNRKPVDNPDLVHYDSLAQIKLGHLFASAVLNQ